MRRDEHLPAKLAARPASNRLERLGTGHLTRPRPAYAAAASRTKAATRLAPYKGLEPLGQLVELRGRSSGAGGGLCKRRGSRPRGRRLGCPLEVVGQLRPAGGPRDRRLAAERLRGRPQLRRIDAPVAQGGERQLLERSPRRRRDEVGAPAPERVVRAGIEVHDTELYGGTRRPRTFIKARVGSNAYDFGTASRSSRVAPAGSVRRRRSACEPAAPRSPCSTSGRRTATPTSIIMMSPARPSSTTRSPRSSRPSAGSTSSFAAPASAATRYAPSRLRRGMAARLRGERERRLLRQPSGHQGDGAQRVRADRQCRLDRRQGGQSDGCRLLGVEGGGHHDDEVHRQGRRRLADPRQLRRPCRDRHGDARRYERGAPRLHGLPFPWPYRQARGGGEPHLPWPARSSPSREQSSTSPVGALSTDHERAGG